MQKPILVFKIGTSSITDNKGNLDEAIVQSVAAQLATLHKKYHIVNHFFFCDFIVIARLP